MAELTRFDDSLLAVHAYMGSDAGKAAVLDALSRRRLPGFLDTDVEEAVLGEAARFLRKGGEISSAAGWCRARITARAVDLVRGTIRDERRWGVRVPFDEEVLGDVFEDDGGDETGPVGSWEDRDGNLDEVRRGLLAAGSEDGAVAGALTFVSVVGDGAAAVPECPRPGAGADESEKAIWVVLWYLGLRDCFGAGNTAAKRRSRAARGVRELLRNWGGRR
jgi:hypothetical protein